MTETSPAALLRQLAQIVLDKEPQIRLVLTALIAGGHVLLEDLPGLGKTTLALGLARSLNLAFARLQMTADTLPGDILGSSFYDPAQQAFVFRRGPIFHSLLLIDEINRAPPRAQSALMEAMAEGQVSLEGASHPLPNPFFVIATQNPQEFDGVFPLPENQLDRFLLSLSLGYPSRMAEERLLQGEALAPEAVPALATEATLLDWQRSARQVFLSPEIRAMLLDLAEYSRRESSLRFGVSPRGLLALQAALRGWAFLQQRDFVAPEDLPAVAPAVLGHRLRWRDPGEPRVQLAGLLKQCWGLGG
ncbi:AAA domain-containing protein [Acidithiobacillus sp. CV18-2]|uniref:AAA domain-containing protein n=1 Tax=Igneacidithiobacillus copahuensis TaxID=2724909 RepID=A0AAE3CJF5_9PROT|nr:AAA domain-containing protein [Acidithiobacillus sp. CV18-3]MBU2757638.1 AAA domain-containing protein [Acidithiobacillus sp. BN09-2]MBU2777047.1 AAA domain-containing protein [Acidithiobacillus sp. CV18-2]MBU2787340.1 AAA domain-containing protein [Igneacidithiobacillus copahuensis]MBU2797359.1 AAA domain-containing protein [Acidithiobacillus sp. VAN18-2]MBU2799802.1 AAA domain-containing protein [Acidithiobacillus sp. VAN18-4]UTV81968.1 AAA family ATPase [Acidithiobacillus sp. YTS05]